jgi:hypothetical protein
LLDLFGVLLRFDLLRVFDVLRLAAARFVVDLLRLAAFFLLARFAVVRFFFPAARFAEGRRFDDFLAVLLLDFFFDFVGVRFLLERLFFFVLVLRFLVVRFAAFFFPPFFFGDFGTFPSFLSMYFFAYSRPFGVSLKRALVDPWAKCPSSICLLMAFRANAMLRPG